MNDNKKLNEFTLVDVIERKIHFTNTNTIFDKTEFQYTNEGELLAYNEMLVDVKHLDEKGFISKYLKIINQLTVHFENEEFKDEKEIEKMTGYNNAIVSILECINPIYLYDLNIKQP